MTGETALLRRFIEQTPYRLDGVRVFRRDIINTVSVHGHRVRNGITGQADAYAVAPGGLHVELEAKAARGAMRKAQEAWQAHCLRLRIPHLVLRAKKNEEPEATVSRWISELGECIDEALNR